VSRIVQRARPGVDHILVDTTGFLEGPLGRALKLNKIRILEPDLVVCLERERECRFLERAFHRRRRPRFIFLPLPPGVRTRSADERTRYRMASLGSHIEGAILRRVNLSEMALSQWPVFIGEPLPAGRRRALAQRIGRRLLWAEVQRDRLVLVTTDPLGWREEERAFGAWGRARVELITPVDLNLRLLGVEDLEGEIRAIGVLNRVTFHGVEAEVWVPPRVGEIGGLRLSEVSLTPEQWCGIRRHES
jgi:polynucleotide 5'-kinase involved in rRNA processing